MVDGTGIVTAAGGDSGNPVTFTSQSTNVCTSGGTNGSTITGLAAGTCTIVADQVGDDNYNPAPPAIQIFSIGKANQIVTIAPCPNIVVGGTCILSATGGGSNNPIIFDSMTPGICACSGTNGSTLTGLAAGICDVSAYQAGNDDYDAGGGHLDVIVTGTCLADPLTINGATFGPGTHTRASQTSIATQGSVMVQTGANVTFRAPFHRYRPGLRVATGAVFRAQTGAVACSAAARTPAAAAPSASASAAGAAVETAPPTAPLPFTGMDALPPWIQERLAARGIDRQAVAQALLDPQGQWLLFETPQGINPADRNGTSDIYRLDLLDERLALLSRAPSGAAGNGPSRYPAADALGDWVVFQSEANDLVSDDDNGVSDIFLHEVPFRTTRRLTATAADQASAHPALDAAGQDLLYDRQHRDGRRQIVADTLWGGVPAVPLGLTRDGTGIAVDSHHPAISADGRFVAYLTGKTGGGGTSTCRIHLGDRDSDRSEELPCPAEVEAASDAVRPNFSADGAQLQWYFPSEDIPVQVYNPLLTVPVGVVP